VESVGKESREGEESENQSKAEVGRDGRRWAKGEGEGGVEGDEEGDEEAGEEEESE
jgi:hypothetical protein